MISQLLSSKPKAKLINLLLAHPKRSFSFTELKESTGLSKNLLKKTLNELSKSGFLVVHVKKNEILPDQQAFCIVSGIGQSSAKGQKSAC